MNPAKPAKPKKPQKRPVSIKIYLPDKNYAEQLEKYAKRYNLSVSQLCLLALNNGMPIVKEKLDQIV